MKRFKLHMRLSALLILVLLSNSSLALETGNHESHQNADPLEVHLMQGLFSASDLATSIPDIGGGDEDCICDGVCCSGSIDFSFSAVDVHYTINDPRSPEFSGFYQSISLDLLLPPPTR